METFPVRAEIKFACSTCGQHILTDAEAEGLTAECPSCQEPIIIPAPRGMFERNYGETAPPTVHEPRVDFQAAEEKIETSTKRRLEAALEECERLTSVATHAQAELKTFQTERRSLKTDLAQLRQRIAGLENKLAEQVAETSRLSETLHAAEAQATASESELTISRQRVVAAETQLAAKEQEIGTVRASLAAAQAESQAIQAEVTLLQDESSLLRKGLDAARAEVAEATETRKRLRSAEAQLSDANAQLFLAQQSAKSLTDRGEKLTAEASELRGSLQKTKAGRELIELRAKLAALQTEHGRSLAEARQALDELHKSEAAQRDLRELLKGTRSQLEQAEKRAEAESGDRVKGDNELLRGIISRQNTELEQRLKELLRLKRARFAVRLLYALFAIGLVGVGFAALELIPRIKF